MTFLFQLFEQGFTSFGLEYLRILWKARTFPVEFEDFAKLLSKRSGVKDLG